MRPRGGTGETAVCDGVKGGRQNDTIMVRVTSLNVRESFDA